MIDWLVEHKKRSEREEEEVEGDNQKTPLEGMESTAMKQDMGTNTARKEADAVVDKIRRAYSSFVLRLCSPNYPSSGTKRVTFSIISILESAKAGATCCFVGYGGLPLNDS